MLTTIQIKSAKAQDRAYKLADSGGLYLLVQPNGSKLWRYKFRVGGVEGKQSFGAFPELSLAEARGLHGDSRKLVAQGINPVQAKQELKIVQVREQLERLRGTFAAVMSDWGCRHGRRAARIHRQTAPAGDRQRSDADAEGPSDERHHAPGTDCASKRG